MAKLARLPAASLPLIAEDCGDPSTGVVFGIGSVPKLVGIARMAADGESLREGHDVEYFTLESRSVLSRVVSQRNLPFTWAINPYRGCEFACKYCYARYTHEFMELRDGIDFEQKIFVKQQAAQLLRRDLKKVKAGEQIAIGTATDPYQPAERRFEVTRAILEEVARHSGLEIGIVTKSNLVTRDAEILRRVAEKNSLFVNVTVTTVVAELARKLEPRAPRPDLRLEAVRQLNLAGVDAGVICAPVLPQITDHPRDLEALVKAARAGAVYADPRQYPQKEVNYGGRVYRNRAFNYIGTRKKCGPCSLRPQCTSAAFRGLIIHQNEPARQRARELVNTSAFAGLGTKAQRVQPLHLGGRPLCLPACGIR